MKSYKEVYAELEHFTNLVILNYVIEQLANNKEEKIDLREWLHGKFISPAKVDGILQEDGWEKLDFDENGWQQDTWYWYAHPDYDFQLTMEYSGFYGDLKLYRRDIDDYV